MNIKENVINELCSRWPNIDRDVICQSLEVPKDKNMGDYAFPCFKLAKTLHKAPNLIAADLEKELEGSMMFDQKQAVGPYLNFFINKEWIAAHVLGQVQKAAEEGKPFGSSDQGAGKTVVLDYSSINVAKPFHIGHLRTTAIGNSLTRIYNFMGYHTVSMNYLGDWGTQFGKMIVAFRKWGDEVEVKKSGIRYLVQLYVKFHQEAEKDDSLNEEARLAFKSMEEGDEEALALWRRFVDISLQDVQKVYQMLDVHFDSYKGEGFFWDKTQPIIDELQEKGLLKDSQGAKIVDLSDDDMPPCLILKKDGSTLYATRDLASAQWRWDTYHFYKAVYITGMEQSLHFAQWFRVMEKLGRPWAKDLVHVPYGLISLEDGHMSTREGKVIWLEDLLKEAVSKVKDIMMEKNPGLENMDEVSQKVGVGAVVFHDLYNSRIKEETFSWDNVLNFDGETGPYVQYTFARAMSVLRKARDQGIDVDGDLNGVEMDCLTDSYAQDVIKLIDGFQDKVQEALDKYEPYFVARYAVALAEAFNRFYHEDAILSADEKTRDARLVLTRTAAGVLKEALYLVGVSAPEKM